MRRINANDKSWVKMFFNKIVNIYVFNKTLFKRVKPNQKIFKGPISL